MAYRFKKNEEIQTGIHRIARERIKLILDQLKAGPKGEVIHEVRKDIKKLRAVLRLVRKSLSKQAYSLEMDSLREAADKLAGVRDAEVISQTVIKLAKSTGAKGSSTELKNLGNCLQDELGTEMARFAKTKSSLALKNVFLQIQQRIPSWELEDSDWDSIGPGLKRTYRKGKKALKLVQQNPRPQNFHEWRKSVKNLWYQTRLLCSSSTDLVKDIDELKLLGEKLGDFHDLSVLLEKTKKFRKIKPPTKNKLISLIKARETKLANLTLKLGIKFYEERPADFCRRMHRYWRQWRN